MPSGLRTLSIGGALVTAFAGAVLLQDSVEERVSGLETRVAALEASVSAGEENASSNSPGNSASVVQQDGATTLSGTAGQSISDPFELTDGNWFARVDLAGTGGVVVIDATQFKGGDNNESLFFWFGDSPASAVTSFTIYDWNDGAGTYVLEVNSEFSWSVTISQEPL